MQPYDKQLKQADYDFSEVLPRKEAAPKLALSACHFYEFARESKEAINVIASRRADGKAFPHHPGKKPHQKMFCLGLLSCTKGYPHTAWRDLSERDKRVLMQVANYLPTLQRKEETQLNPPVKIFMNEPGAITLDEFKQQYLESHLPEYDGEPTKIGFIAINAKYDATIMSEEFHKIHRALAGKPMLQNPFRPREPREYSGRTSLRDELNALAAMRLRSYCANFAQAKRKLDKTDGMCHYARLDAFNRACNRAPEYFRKAFGWLDPGGPVNFTAGWRR